MGDDLRNFSLAEELDAAAIYAVSAAFLTLAKGNLHPHELSEVIAAIHAGLKQANTLFVDGN